MGGGGGRGRWWRKEPAGSRAGSTPAGLTAGGGRTGRGAERKREREESGLRRVNGRKPQRMRSGQLKRRAVGPIKLSVFLTLDLCAAVICMGQDGRWPIGGARSSRVTKAFPCNI